MLGTMLARDSLRKIVDGRVNGIAPEWCLDPGVVRREQAAFFNNEYDGQRD